MNDNQAAEAAEKAEKAKEADAKAAEDRANDEAKAAAKADEEMRREAAPVEADHKAGKGLRNGWSYSPTRDPKYMKTADAKRRRLTLVSDNQLPGNGTPDRLLEAGFKEKPDLTQKRR